MSSKEFNGGLLTLREEFYYIGQLDPNPTTQ